MSSLSILKNLKPSLQQACTQNTWNVSYIAKCSTNSLPTKCRADLEEEHNSSALILQILVQT